MRRLPFLEYALLYRDYARFGAILKSEEHLSNPLSSMLVSSKGQVAPSDTTELELGY
jgi:hypothetical protein